MMRPFVVRDRHKQFWIAAFPNWVLAGLVADVDTFALFTVLQLYKHGSDPHIKIRFAKST
jgi:hypothetical protein